MKYTIVLLLSIFQLSLFSCSEDDTISSKTLTLDKTSIEILVGAKETISITEAPDNGSTAVWSSSDENVATVFFGEVTAITSGTATITVTMGQEVAECKVNVPERTYELVWADEFEGTSLNTDNWTFEIGTGSWGWGNDEKQYYTDRTENIRVEDGLLTIEVKKEDYNGSQYTSARIKTAGKRAFKYGKIEVRLKVPLGKGTWPAFWMLPSTGSWPDAGEIDIMEHVGKDPANIHSALHTKNKNGMNGQNFKGSLTLDGNIADDFCVITMEWVENEIMGYDRIYIYVDGEKLTTFGETAQLQESGDWPFNEEFYFILNLAIGGSWGGTIDDSMFEDPVLYQVDYVRVYQLK